MRYGIDIFSGAGGLSLGAEMAGIRIKTAIDLPSLQNGVCFKIPFMKFRTSSPEVKELDC